MKLVFSLHRILPLAGLLALPLGTGCETILSSNTRLEQDVLEIKTRLNENITRQEGMERAIDSQLTTLAENVEKNGNLAVTSMEELQRRLAEQQEELNKLRGEVEAINIGMRNRAPGGGYQGGNTFGGTDPFNSQPGTDLNGQPVGPGDPAAAGLPPTGDPQTASPAQQAFTAATELYNGGQYPQAREAFTQALGQNPTGELRSDILFGLAESCNAMKDTEGAVKSYNDVIRSDPRNPKSWISLERLADIDIAQGNRDSAIRRLEWIDQKNPRYRDLERVRQKLAQLRGNAPAAQ